MIDTTETLSRQGFLNYSQPSKPPGWGNLTMPSACVMYSHAHLPDGVKSDTQCQLLEALKNNRLRPKARVISIAFCNTVILDE